MLNIATCICLASTMLGTPEPGRWLPGVVARQVAAQGNAARRADRAYVLGPEDVLSIQVLDSPEISQRSYRVDTDGGLRLPMAGSIWAADMTLERLELEIAQRLREYLNEPDVTVSVSEFRSQPVSVLGAFKSSGVHQLQGRKTLVEMLSLAGGLEADAGPTVSITRQAEWGAIPLAEARLDPVSGASIAEINLRLLMAASSPEKNIAIRPYDVISVPRAEMVFVIGEVGKAGPIPLNNGNSVSVIEAVSSAGGLQRTAKPAHARILRRGQSALSVDTKRTEIDVDLRKVMAGKADDLQLMAGDILVVPQSTSKRASLRIVEAAFQAGLIIVSYGVAR